LFVYFLIYTIKTHIVKNFTSTMHVNYLSHFIIINASHQYKKNHINTTRY
jgi:hypothetical protein